MRILQINNTHSIKGGADRVYFNTGKLMASFGHDVSYFSTFENDIEKSEFSKYFIRFKNKREAGFFSKLSSVKDYIYNNHAYDNLSKLIHDFQPEIAHVHLFCGGLSLSILKALKKYDIPIVQSVHDYRLLCPANAFLDANNQICEKCYNRSYYQCAVKQCVDRNFFYSSMVSIEAYFRKYFINPIEYIDHFLFVSQFAKNKHIDFDDRFRTKSDHQFNFTYLPPSTKVIYPEKKYLLFYGRLSVEKGLTTLLSAIEDVDIDLKIVGTGPQYNVALEYSRTHENIHVLGYKSGSELDELIANAYFIVVPSEWYENNPMTILEAYSVNKPVIGARIGGIPEIVHDHKTGFLFESRNTEDLTQSIRKAMDMTEPEYIEMASAARRFAEENFSPEIHYEKLLFIYSNLISHAK